MTSKSDALEVAKNLIKHIEEIDDSPFQMFQGVPLQYVPTETLKKVMDEKVEYSKRFSGLIRYNVVVDPQQLYKIREVSAELDRRKQYNIVVVDSQHVEM